MKRQITIFIFAAIALIGGLFYSCSKETTTQDEQLDLKAAKVASTATLATTDLNSSTCGTCVSIWKETEATSSAFYKVLPNSSDLVSGVNLTISNDNANIYFKVFRSQGTFTQISINSVVTKFDVAVSEYSWKVEKPTWANCDKYLLNLGLQGASEMGFCSGSFSYSLRELCTSTTLTSNLESPVCVGKTMVLTATVSAGEAIKGGSINIYKDGAPIATVDVKAGSNSIAYEYIPTAEGTAVFTASYTGSTGYKPSTADAPISVIAQNCAATEINCDTEGFSYETLNNKDIIFYYNSAEPVNAEVEFTFPHIEDMPLNADGKYVAPDGKIYTVNNPTNQTNFTWTGEINCKKSVTSFSFNLTPLVNASGKAEVWTDFKVDGQSKKSEITTPNIVYPQKK